MFCVHLQCIHNTGTLYFNSAAPQGASLGTGFPPTFDLAPTSPAPPLLPSSSPISLPSVPDDLLPTSIDANPSRPSHRLPDRHRWKVLHSTHPDTAHTAPRRPLPRRPLRLSRSAVEQQETPRTPRRHDHIKPCKSKIYPWHLISLINLFSHCVRSFCPPYIILTAPLGAEDISAPLSPLQPSAASKQALAAS